MPNPIYYIGIDWSHEIVRSFVYIVRIFTFQHHGSCVCTHRPSSWVFVILVVGMNFVLYAMMGTDQTTTTLCSHWLMFLWWCSLLCNDSGIYVRFKQNHEGQWNQVTWLGHLSVRWIWLGSTVRSLAIIHTLVPSPKQKFCLKILNWCESLFFTLGRGNKKTHPYNWQLLNDVQKWFIAKVEIDMQTLQLSTKRPSYIVTL